MMAGMYVGHDHGGGIREQRRGEHGARFDRDRIQTATAHLVVGQCPGHVQRAVAGRLQAQRKVDVLGAERVEQGIETSEPLE